mmetsp:Transcript_36059/g.92914  ORF Transcript_36059/g.92914 Transcript_36059/m.92914 type:complete len:277 (+) Transcript_36059:175-1005(+)
MDEESPQVDLEGKVASTEDSLDRKLARALMEWPTFGLFSIFKTHPSIGIANKMIKLSALLLLVVQIVIPVALFLSKKAEYDSGYCPDVATPSLKVLFSTIALLYTIRTASTISSKCVHWDNSSDENSVGPMMEQVLRERTELGLGGSRLNDIGQFDAVMTLSYDALLYILNLWFIFIEEDPVEMVMNALAMEFVTRLDDEYKALYLKYNGLAVSEIIKNEWHLKNSSKMLGDVPLCFCSTSPLLCCTAWANRIGALLAVLVPVACLVMTVYGPICK